MPYNSVTGWKPEPPKPEHKVRPVIALILCLFLLVFLMGAMQKRDAEPVMEYQRITEYDLSKCTPVGARVTPLVRFEIESRSDGRALIKGCSREADRALIPSHRVLSTN